MHLEALVGSVEQLLLVRVFVVESLTGALCSLIELDIGGHIGLQVGQACLSLEVSVVRSLLVGSVDTLLGSGLGGLVDTFRIIERLVLVIGDGCLDLRQKL